MKVALTVWAGRISPVFDVSREALILNIENRKIVSTSREALDGPAPHLKVERLVSLGVETLICGAISEPLHVELTSRGVKVLGFVAGDVEKVTQAFLAGGLPAPALSMPGCASAQKRFRVGRGGGRRRGGNGWGRKG